jgi:DNA-directed RNA polymerase subunit RPC12/RpoP
MVNPQLMLTEFRSRRSGINFVCSRCGNLLHHVGIDGVADGYGNKASRSAYALQSPLSDIQNACPKCGRKLNFDFDPDVLIIEATTPDGQQ